MGFIIRRYVPPIDSDPDSWVDYYAYPGDSPAYEMQAAHAFVFREQSQALAFKESLERWSAYEEDGYTYEIQTVRKRGRDAEFTPTKEQDEKDIAAQIAMRKRWKS